MNKSIDYIKTGIRKLPEMEWRGKLKFIFSSTNVITSKNLKDESLVKELLDIIERLRYDMSYNKAYEALPSIIDVNLTYEALRLSRIIYKGKMLEKYIKDVLYYEINEGIKEELQKEIEDI